MDINGAKAIKSRYPDNSISIFLDRDKIDLVMAILERSVSNEEKAKRIIQLDEDEKARHQCDFVVKNDNLEKAIKEVKSYIA